MPVSAVLKKPRLDRISLQPLIVYATMGGIMTALDVLEYLASAPAEEVGRIFRLAKRLRADTHKPQAQHEAEALSAAVVEGAQLTIRAMTESVLKDRGQAMHVTELSAAIREQFKTEDTGNYRRGDRTDGEKGGYVQAGWTKQICALGVGPKPGDP